MSYGITIKSKSADQDDIKAVLSQHTSIIKKSIEVEEPRTWEHQPKTSVDGRLYIHLLASPGRTQTCRIEKIYGNTFKNLLALVPTDANPILYSQSGTPIAEYTENNLYVLFDFGEIPIDKRAEVIDTLLKDYELSLKNFNSPDEVVKRLLRLVHLNIESDSSIESELIEVDEELKNLRARMLSKMILHRTITSRRSIQQKVNEYFTEDFARNMYDQLQTLGSGEKVSVCGYEIHIPLGKIKISHDGNTYMIGDTVLVVNLSSKNGGVKCINKTGSQDGHPHPFADKAGNLYLGSLSDSVAKLLGEIELAPMVSMIIEYLQTYNESDAQLSIEHWPTTLKKSSRVQKRRMS